MAIVHSAGLCKWARQSLLIAALVAAPAAYSEVVSQPPEDPGTLLGNYLSGRMARGAHDTIAAADFYSKALAGDPGNEIILEQTFLLEAASAHWDRAIQLAQDLVKIEPAHRIARFLLGCEAFKQGNYKEADEHFAAARHAVNANNRKLARQTLKTHISKSSGHALSESLLAAIEEGKTPPLLVATPTEGLAEVFYGIGDALAGEGGLDMGIIFLQFALYLEPDFPLAYAALAEAYESAKKYELEMQALDQIKPDSPLWLNVQIQKSFALNSLERLDDAKALLEELIKKDPSDVRPLDALGNILRSHERYGEGREYYTRALALIPKPTKENWTLFYSRGVCNERLKNWPEAEADFKEALALSPDEPLVLNYLGYSWVDQGRNLKQAMDYIRKAVKLKPDDGYYVDSLGWAYYRLGNLPAAVANLERAVELKPDDPIINDHLGDAYWRVGRTLEAKYQWEQALTLKPEDDQIVTLKQKIEAGLPAPAETKAASDRTTQGGG